MKKCSWCKQDKDVCLFRRHSFTRDKLDSWCITCRNERRRETRKHNPEQKWIHWQENLLKYGVSPEWYGNQRFIIQNNKCGICSVEMIEGKLSQSANVDHDHRTGNAREILCHNCNKNLGQIESYLQRTLDMILYLKKHKES